MALDAEEGLATAEGWAGVADSDAGPVPVLKWAAGMEEATEGVFFILLGERDTPRPMVPTP